MYFKSLLFKYCSVSLLFVVMSLSLQNSKMLTTLNKNVPLLTYNFFLLPSLSYIIQGKSCKVLRLLLFLLLLRQARVKK